MLSALGELNFAWSVTVHFHGFISPGWQEHLCSPVSSLFPLAALLGSQAHPIRLLQVCVVFKKHPLLLQPPVAYVGHLPGAAVDFPAWQFSLLRYPEGEGICGFTWVQSTWVFPLFQLTSVAAGSCFLPVTRTW